MYIAITGSKNNKDVYIYQSFRKEDGKSSSRIYNKPVSYTHLDVYKRQAPDCASVQKTDGYGCGPDPPVSLSKEMHPL